MSYILDALQRAEAERQHNQVPGLHSPGAAAAALPSPPPNRPWQRWGWLAGGVLTATGLTWLTWLMLRGPAGEAPMPVPAVLQKTPAATAAPPTVQADASTNQPQAPVSPPLPDKAPVAGPPAPTVAKAVAPAAKPHRQPASVPVKPVPSQPPLLADLPDALRREVPSLQITGAVYSANPAQRLLVVNNQVLNQGSQAAPGVQLEEIQPHSSVFSFKGSHFRVSH